VKLPNADRAIVDMVKLSEYALNQNRSARPAQSRVFMAVLGLTARDVAERRNALLESARSDNAVRGTSDEFGTRYSIDFEMMRGPKQACVRGCWIIRIADGLPRLTSCYVL